METKNKLTSNNEAFLISYMQLRMFIGLLGFFLPLSLILIVYLLNDQSILKISISHYYYSYGHIIFVGTLCILGGLFGTYRGKSSGENWVSNLSGMFAVLVAVFPTKFEGYEGSGYIGLTVYPCWFNVVHYLSALLLFISFGVFCLIFFQRTDTQLVTSLDILKKGRRNLYYKICGWGIFASLIGIAIFTFFDDKHPSNFFEKYYTIIFEMAALFFFSTSWLLKSSEFWNKKIPFISYFR